MKTDLSRYDNSWYKPGASLVKRVAWYYVNVLVFKSYFLPLSGLKVLLLRIFGAKVGRDVNVKPYVNIKYPWFLTIGNNVWIGEGVWIDNLANVFISDNVCLSQGAFLLTGNHNYTTSNFDLVTKEIVIEEGVWIGAKAIVCPGVICKSHSVLSVASVANKSLDAYTVNSGNPAIKIRERIILN